MAEFESYQQGTPSWLEFSSSDQQASKEFYGQLFGWDFEDNPMTDENGTEVGMYSIAKLGDKRIAGLGPLPAESQPPSWGIYLAADDVDQAVAKAEQAGGTVLAPAMDVPDQGRMAWVQDPTGAAVGLWQEKGFAGSQLANEPGTLIWNELTVADFDKAAPFYEAVLGMGRKSESMEGEEDYPMLTVDGREVAGHFPPPTEDTPPHWNVYFNVADTDAAVQQAEQLGAGKLAEPMDIPGVGRLAFLSDPQGATFNLMGPESGQQGQQSQQV